MNPCLTAQSCIGVPMNQRRHGELRPVGIHADGEFHRVENGAQCAAGQANNEKGKRRNAALSAKSCPNPSIESLFETNPVGLGGSSTMTFSKRIGVGAVSATRMPDYPARDVTFLCQIRHFMPISDRSLPVG